ncbi:MAG: ABC transporter [Gaiellaceae bacterium]|jgi:lipopolysaccharide transport system ATP-binding protein|nr:MAG: ABC transporter [Gaiellaceae bacterium]
MAKAIVVEELGKRYRIGQLQSAYGTLRDALAEGAARIVRRERKPTYEEIWALRDVSFEVTEGEVLGVLGRNGAGKSTLLKILTRITNPTTGTATIRGRVGSLLEVGTGFHPELTGRENIFLNGSILGMKRKEILRKFDEIVEFAGVEKFIDTPVKRYSSGMSVRLAFAVAAHLEPEILLVDEVLAVGDAEFQRRCLGRMEDISMTGRTVLFVSHNMQTLTALCNRAIWLDQGAIVRDGKSSEVVAQYLQAGFGTGSQREWPDVETAPGNQYVRMRFVRVVQDGRVVDAVDVRRPVGIEIGFRVFDGAPPLFPKIKLWDAQSNVAFNAMDTSRRWDDPPPPGDYVCTAWIPGNLLNEGLMTVLTQICSIDVTKLWPHASGGNVAFHVQDPGEGDSARGRYAGQWKGVVRPLLDWTTEWS